MSYRVSNERRVSQEVPCCTFNKQNKAEARWKTAHPRPVLFFLTVFVTTVFGTRDSSGLILFLATLQPFVIVHHDSQCLQAGAMFFTGILNCGLANLNPGPHVLWNDQNTGWLVSGHKSNAHHEQRQTQRALCPVLTFSRPGAGSRLRQQLILKRVHARSISDGALPTYAEPCSPQMSASPAVCCMDGQDVLCLPAQH